MFASDGAVFSVVIMVVVAAVTIIAANWTAYGAEVASSQNTEHLTYVNPVLSVGSADPGVIKASDGTYYMYNTFGFAIHSSLDLAHWRRVGGGHPIGSWGVADFWAPEVIEDDGRYYMFYSAERAEGGKRIGLAIADRPQGPFVDVGTPVFDFGFPVIDAHPFMDDDGRKYLFFAKDQVGNDIGGYESHLYGVEMADDWRSAKGEPVLLTRPDQAWELRSGNRRWNEGPYVIKINDTYYLMYSANFFGGLHYSVGYATATNPLGPYTKYAHNPILRADDWTPGVSGPGHHSVVASPDDSELWIVYHIHADPAVGGGDRRVAIDRLGVRDDGSLYVSGPTMSPQPLPSGATEWTNIAPFARVTTGTVKKGHRPEALVDGEVVVDPAKAAREWVSGSNRGSVTVVEGEADADAALAEADVAPSEGPLLRQADDPWVRLTWEGGPQLRYIFLYGSSMASRRAQSVTVHLSDGTVVRDIPMPANASEAAVVEVSGEKDVAWIEVVLHRRADQNEVALSEMIVLGLPGDWSVDDTGLVWIESPVRGERITGEVAVRVHAHRVAPVHVTLELDDENVYEGDRLPEGFVLKASELSPGDHRLTVSARDPSGRLHQYTANFNVEHLRLDGVDDGDRLRGDVTMSLTSGLPAEDVLRATVHMVPVVDGTVGDESVVFYTGEHIPDDVIVHSGVVDDGAYDLVVTIETRAEVVSHLKRRVVVNNWDVLRDALKPPVPSTWFGNLSQLKTVDASSGWAFATDDPELFDGDAHRMYVAGGEAQSLIWHKPGVDKFHLTAYVRRDAADDMTQIVQRAVTFSVSADKNAWHPVAYEAEVVSAGEGGDGEYADYAMVVVEGNVSPDTDADYVRLVVEPILSDTDVDTALQLGEVALFTKLAP